MSEPSPIRWLNVLGVVAATAALCAPPLDALRPREPSIHACTDAVRLAGLWLGLVLVAMIPASMSAVVSQRRGSANPTKTGTHVGVIAVTVTTMLAAFGARIAF